MSLSDELKELQALLDQGTLTQEEFELAKRRVLEESRVSELATDMDELKLQNQLAQLELDWIKEREQYMVANRYGGQNPPAPIAAILFWASLGGIFGVVMTIWGFTVRMPRGGPNPIPWYGLTIVAIAITGGAFCCVQASFYEEALRQYHRRRRKLQNRQLEISDEVKSPNDV